MSDPINKPEHYTTHKSGVEAVQICERCDYLIGNVIKYCWRAKKKKNELQDLQKAAWYLRRRISRLTDDPVQLAHSEHVMTVIRSEPEGTLLSDVLWFMFRQHDQNLEAALARIEREIEIVRER